MFRSIQFKDTEVKFLTSPSKQNLKASITTLNTPNILILQCCNCDHMNSILVYTKIA